MAKITSSYANGLGTKISSVRLEELKIEEPVTLHQVDWMDCAHQIPKTKNLMHQKLDELANKNYDWNNIRKKYTKTELDSMSGWLLNKKAEDEINFLLFIKQIL